MHICSLLFIWLLVERARAYSPLPRWGQASAIFSLDTLFIYGGRTDEFNQYGYYTAPPINDILYLPLGSSFTTDSPPWYLSSSSTNTSTSQGPAVAWHTLSAFNSSYLLAFGGDFGPNDSNTVLPTLADSAALLNAYDHLLPQWTVEPTSWANEPIRRMYHAASSSQGLLWITGGEKVDGSGTALSDHWVFDPTQPGFTSLPTSGAPPDVYGHASIVTSAGLLCVFGGYSESQSGLLSFAVIYTLDTTKSGSELVWKQVAIGGTLPDPRRGFAAAYVKGQIFIHGGGDADLQTIYSDGWVLDMNTTPWTWTEVSALATLGARVDHSAIPVGDQIVFAFGFGSSAPASSTLQIYDTSSNSWTSTYTPPDPSSIPTTLPVSNPTATGTGSGSSPTVSSGPGSSNPDGGPPNSDPAGHTTAIAVGAAFGGLALVAAGFAAAVYVKRGGANRRFRHLSGVDDDAFHPGYDGEFGYGIRAGALGAVAGVAAVGMGGMGDYGDEGDGSIQRYRDFDDQESVHGAGGPIPMARGYEGEKAQWKGVGSKGMGSWLPASVFGAAAVAVGAGRHARPVQERRDMLADEDTRQFYYNTPASRSTWSLKSVGAMIGGRMGLRSREPSTMSTGVRGDVNRQGSIGAPTPWREKTDPFSDGAALLGDDESGFVGAAAANLPPGAMTPVTPRPQYRRDQSYASYASSRRSTATSYNDPFSDPIAAIPEDRREGSNWSAYSDLDDEPPKAYSYGQQRDYPYPPPTMPQAGTHTLSPLAEAASDPSLSSHSHSHSNTHTLSQAHSTGVTPFDSITPGTSNTSHIGSQTGTYFPKISSIMSAVATSAPVRRSDSWWNRFSRTPLLDRRKSDASARQFDIRDPNPPPRLVPIEESRNGSQTTSRHPSDGSKGEKNSAGPSAKHSKSVSSLRTNKTVDSEALERMGGGLDIMNRVYRGSSGDSTFSDDFSHRRDSSVFGQDPVMSPSEMSHGSRVPSPPVSSAGKHTPSPLGTPSNESGRPMSGVAARIQSFERRMSQDTDSQNSNPKSSRKSIHGRSVLAVANPDRSQSSST